MRDTTITNMARKRRNTNRKRNSRRGGARTKPPTVFELFAWWTPVLVIAVLMDWLVIRYIIVHHERYGHWVWPFNGMLVTGFLTAAALTIPGVWIYSKLKSRSK